MKLLFVSPFFFLSFFVYQGTAQTTNVVVLDSAEMGRVKEVIATDPSAKILYDSIVSEAEIHLRQDSRSLRTLHYEGLLDTNPDRIDTQKSLDRLLGITDIIYASYGSSDDRYADKARQLILDWASTYEPTGNTINENKFCPLLWGYYLFKNHFSSDEQQKVEQWMKTIAQKQMDRPHTPNNNWQAKRMKMVGMVGCITDNQPMKDFSLAGLKEYINTAYYADSTSQDLMQRDALHYHVSGLEPLLDAFINLSKFDPAFDLYAYQSPAGASVEKSVAYVLPFATGERTRQEWVNSKVALDHQRAAAGIEKYQPGKLFDPAQALPLFAWARYYNADWYELLNKRASSPGYAVTWVGLLNSSLVRN